MTVNVSKERTRNYLRQMKGSIVYKAGAMLASFLAIPMMLRYLGQEQFGVWSTLLTVMSWIVFFDLGVGNGLRNKVAEALAKNNKAEAANFIASGYSIVGLISMALWILVTSASFYVPWQIVFNTQGISEATLRLTVQVAVFFVVLNFWIGLISAILGAIQKTEILALSQLITNAIVLCFVYMLTKITNSNITHLSLAYGFSMVIVNIGISWWFYQLHPELRPKLNINKNHLSPLLSLGMQFFTIQIAMLLIFMTDKIMITQFFGPEYVTQYDIVLKLFSIINVAHALITAPLCSAYTDAYHRNDLIWIKKMLIKQLLIFGIVILAIIILAGLCKQIIKIWIGDEFQTSTSLIVSMSLLVLISTWNNIFGLILGGIGKIRLGSIYTILIAILNIPLSYLIAVKLGFGVSGVVIGTILSIAISGIISPIQVYYFIYSKNKNKLIEVILR